LDRRLGEIFIAHPLLACPSTDEDAAHLGMSLSRDSLNEILMLIPPLFGMLRRSWAERCSGVVFRGKMYRFADRRLPLGL
jgi:hypothetical protein